MKNKLPFDLKAFTPPRGTTKTVELSLGERKRIGRRKLAEYVEEQFEVGTRVTVKYHGSYYTLSRESPTLFSVTKRHSDMGAFASRSSGIVDLLTNRFEPTTLLRIVKLIEKNARDKESMKRQTELAILQLMGNTISLAYL